jgi:hypothetical protein
VFLADSGEGVVALIDVAAPAGSAVNLWLIASHGQILILRNVRNLWLL